MARSKAACSSVKRFQISHSQVDVKEIKKEEGGREREGKRFVEFNSRLTLCEMEWIIFSHGSANTDSQLVPTSPLRLNYT